VEKSNNSVLQNLKDKGMADDRSRWMITVNDKGEIVIYNECITAAVFDFLDSKAFAEVSKSFDEIWGRVFRLPLESDWFDYVPSPGSNGRIAFKQFGWRMKGSLFTPRSDGDTDEYPNSVLVAFPRKNMDEQ